MEDTGSYNEKQLKNSLINKKKGLWGKAWKEN